MQRRSLLAIALIVAACRGPAAVDGTSPLSSAVTTAAPIGHAGHVLSPNNEPLPVRDLAIARKATARYQDVLEALKDGYADIGVVLPNMGRHFLKDSLVDARFEVERPEVLVYQEDLGGRFKLVAVEYAVPLPLSATAPEGFPGGADQWFPDQRFNLWTLHAWVFRENPDGIFNPTNRRVP